MPPSPDDREPLIVFLERDSLAPSVAVRRPSFPHRWVEHPRTAPGEVAERVAGATIAIVNKVQVRAPALERLPDLRLIAVSATGTDCVDTAWCDRHGVLVTNIRGYAVRTVPEHTFALILALRRSLPGWRDSVRDGAWQRSGQFCFFDHPIRDLYGSRLGIVGGGTLGSAVGALGRAFGMDVVYAARKGGPGTADRLPFDEVFATSDVLTLHCPLKPDTQGLIGAREIGLMKRDAILINASRGGLVDEAALAEALLAGRIAGAGFDVATTEPPAPDNPLMGLLDLPNFILTPHVAWSGRDAMQALADQLTEILEAFHAGRPFNVVAGAQTPLPKGERGTQREGLGG